MRAACLGSLQERGRTSLYWTAAHSGCVGKRARRRSGESGEHGQGMLQPRENGGHHGGLQRSPEKEGASFQHRAAPRNTRTPEQW